MILLFDGYVLDLAMQVFSSIMYVFESDSYLF